MARMEFGYNPPSGERKLEIIRPRDYLGDLHRALDVASQSFGSLWVSDHLAYADEFRIECWTLLTWIAARYPGPKLGTIVMCNSFRQPSLMAKMAASLQHMSAGRLILGYGAGWYENEYRMYGFDYPTPRVRMEQFEEAVEIMKLMWREAPASFTGKHYRIENAYCEPRPETPPIMMLGAYGDKFGLRIVARHADWWNVTYRAHDELRQKLATLREHCAAEGRDVASIRKTLAVRIYIDRSQSKALAQADEQKQSLTTSVAGDPVAVREQLAALTELGFDFAVVTFPHFQELDDMKLFVDQVLPHLS